jgi:hypothetical protein
MPDRTCAGVFVNTSLPALVRRGGRKNIRQARGRRMYVPVASFVSLQMMPLPVASGGKYTRWNRGSLGKERTEDMIELGMGRSFSARRGWDAGRISCCVFAIDPLMRIIGYWDRECVLLCARLLRGMKQTEKLV